MDLQIVNELDGSQSIFMYIPGFMQKQQEFYLKKLNKFTNDDWKAGEYKHHDLNRIQRFYSITGKPFCEHWKNIPERWKSCTYEEWLTNLQNEVQMYINDTCEGLINSHESFNPVNFESALINKYRNGNDFIPEHRDVVVMDRDPTIASVSFGETRTFRVNRVVYDPNDPRKLVRDNEFRHFSKEWQLKSGDLVVMAGSAQKYFSHEILQDQTTNPRFNITFR